MGTIGSLLLKLFLDSLFAAFGDVLIDMFKTFQIERSSRAAGRAEAIADQARIGRETAEDMAQIREDDIDVAARLREGTA